MDIYSVETKAELKRRLRRIEGQVRGVERMIDEGRECREVVQQMAAIRSAIHQTSLLLLRSYAARCFGEEDMKARDLLVDDLMRLMAKSP